jgi:hypothetical protein
VSNNHARSADSGSCSVERLLPSPTPNQLKQCLNQGTQTYVRFSFGSRLLPPTRLKTQTSCGPIAAPQSADRRDPPGPETPKAQPPGGGLGRFDLQQDGGG